MTLQNILTIIQILTSLENSEPVKSAPVQKKPAPSQSLFVSQGLQELLKIDITTLTPIEALNMLYKLQAAAKAETGNI
ncbi:MAG: hypothetical protein IJT73_06155 [Selenomonadaceae bacterium]|nr:hypothetical protein [Selenomonadaceae bacterium]